MGAWRVAGIDLGRGRTRGRSFPNAHAHCLPVCLSLLQATVIEALLFSARMRLPAGLLPDTAALLGYVSGVMDVVELRPLMVCVYVPYVHVLHACPTCVMAVRLRVRVRALRARRALRALPAVVHTVRYPRKRDHMYAHF